MDLPKPTRVLILAALLALLAGPVASAAAPVRPDSSDTVSAAEATSSTWAEDLRDGLVALWQDLLSIFGGDDPGGKTPGSEIDPDGHQRQ